MSPKQLRIIVLTLILPLLCAGMLLWSFGSRAQSLNRISAAIVNQDTGAEFEIDGKATHIPMGRQLVAELLQPGAKRFDWQIVRAETATAGLRDGKYGVTVTIPPDFSQKIKTMGTTEATTATVKVLTNDADSLVVPLVAQEVVDAAAIALGRDLSTQMLERIYLGFETQKQGLTEAADGASKLASGTERAATGANTAASGAGALATGQRQFTAGLGQYLDGVGQAATGAGELAGGLGHLATGADSLAKGLGQLRDGIVGDASSPGLAGGLAQIQRGITGDGTTPGLGAGAAQIAAGTRQLADQLTALENTLQRFQIEPPDPALIAQLRELLAAARADWQEIEDAWANARASRDEIAAISEFLRACPLADTPAYCQRLHEYADRLEAIELPGEMPDQIRQTISELEALAARIQAGDPAAQLDQLLAKLQSLRTDLYGDGAANPGLFAGVRQLASGAQQLSDGINGTPSTPGLRQGVDQLVAGVSQIQDGLDGTATLPGLVPGSRQLAAGLAAAAAGSDRLATGLGQASANNSRLLGGSRDLATGAGALSGGLTELSSGLDQLSAGSDELARGLSAGAAQIPSYSAAQRDQIIRMAVKPITAEAGHLNPANRAATALYPLAATLALWLGAFTIFLIRPAIRKSVLNLPVTATVVTWRSWWPGALISLAQALITAVLLLALGVNVARPAWAIITLCLGAITFVSINQALIAVFGMRTGRIVALIFLVVQAVTLSGILPIETMPVTLRALHELLPLAIVASGLREFVVGSSFYGVAGIIIPLLLWLVASLAATRAVIPLVRKRVLKR